MGRAELLDGRKRVRLEDSASEWERGRSELSETEKGTLLRVIVKRDGRAFP